MRLPPEVISLIDQPSESFNIIEEIPLPPSPLRESYTPESFTFEFGSTPPLEPYSPQLFDLDLLNSPPPAQLITIPNPPHNPTIDYQVRAEMEKILNIKEPKKKRKTDKRTLKK